jgi:AraC-like DNA-binding protein
MWFHVVTQGQFWLETATGDPHELGAAGFGLVPHGNGHVLRSEPGAPVRSIDSLPMQTISDRYDVLRHGGGGPRTTLICGAVRLNHPAAHDLVALMPDVLYVDSHGPLESEWMHTALRLMASEARTVRPGGETVITRLCDILIIQAIRAWIDREPDALHGWLGALHDPQVGRAISTIHRDPARAWTVALLAREVTLSRSAFAARFTDLVGETPMAYLTRWRMQVGRSWLLESDVTVSEVATRLGYGSEASFNRAFRRTMGVPPGSLKRERRESRVTQLAV